MTEPIPSDWYSEFFTELPNDFWRRAVPKEATAADVDFIEQRLGLKPRSRIIDVPCGSGRHAIALAQRGHRVVGVDISTEAIGHAQSAAIEANVNVEFIVGEMRTIPSDGSFDAAVCMGNSFGYLDIDGTRHFVEALAAAIRPGGGLVIDYSMAAESVLPGFVDDQPRDTNVGDIAVTGSNTYDIANSRMISRYGFERGSERLEVTALHHIYTVGQIRKLLENVGFTDIDHFSGPEGAAFTIGNPRLLIVADRALGTVGG